VGSPECLDRREEKLGTFDDRMADARKHLLEPRADLTLADLLALFDLFDRPVRANYWMIAGTVP
jgi:hypothetical protein